LAAHNSTISILTVTHHLHYLYERITMSFFFQAEDGIRDGHVTGVQTCALPIFRAAGTTSIRGISSGGLSGCATRQRSWRRQRAKISAGGMPLEELVSSVSGPVTCSIEPNSFCLAIASSGIASITQSAS